LLKLLGTISASGLNSLFNSMPIAAAINRYTEQMTA